MVPRRLRPEPSRLLFARLARGLFVEMPDWHSNYAKVAFRNVPVRRI